MPTSPNHKKMAAISARVSQSGQTYARLLIMSDFESSKIAKVLDRMINERWKQFEKEAEKHDPKRLMALKVIHELDESELTTKGAKNGKSDKSSV